MKTLGFEIMCLEMNTDYSAFHYLPLMICAFKKIILSMLESQIWLLSYE